MMNNNDKMSPEVLANRAQQAVYIACRVLSRGEIDWFDRDMPIAREYSKNFLEWLEYAQQRKFHFEYSQFTILLDDIRNTIELIRKVPVEFQKDVDELFDIWTKCNKVTKELFENYKILTKKLEDVINEEIQDVSNDDIKTDRKND